MYVIILENNRISQIKEQFGINNITNLDEIKNEGINKLKAESNRLKKYVLVNHLLYMDVLKLCNSKQEDLKKQIEKVYKYS